MELKKHIKDVPLHGLINKTPENPRRIHRQEQISEDKSAKPSWYKDRKRKYVPERLKTINNIATSYYQKIPKDVMLIIFLVSWVFILSNLGDHGKKKVVIEMYKKNKVFCSNHGIKNERRRRRERKKKKKERKAKKKKVLTHPNKSTQQKKPYMVQDIYTQKSYDVFHFFKQL